MSRGRRGFFSWKLFFTFSFIYDVLNCWRVFVTKPSFIADLFRWQLSNKGDEIGRDILPQWRLSGVDYSHQPSIHKQKPNTVRVSTVRLVDQRSKILTNLPSGDQNAAWKIKVWQGVILEQYKNLHHISEKLQADKALTVSLSTIRFAICVSGLATHLTSTLEGGGRSEVIQTSPVLLLFFIQS